MFQSSLCAHPLFILDDECTYCGSKSSRVPAAVIDQMLSQLQVVDYFLKIAELAASLLYQLYYDNKLLISLAAALSL